MIRLPIGWKNGHLFRGKILAMKNFGMSGKMSLQGTRMDGMDSCTYFVGTPAMSRKIAWTKLGATWRLEGKFRDFINEQQNTTTVNDIVYEILVG